MTLRLNEIYDRSAIAGPSGEMTKNRRAPAPTIGAMIILASRNKP
jgi:hypothetical protein